MLPIAAIHGKAVGNDVDDARARLRRIERTGNRVRNDEIKHVLGDPLWNAIGRYCDKTGILLSDVLYGESAFDAFASDLAYDADSREAFLADLDEYGATPAADAVCASAGMACDEER